MPIRLIRLYPDPVLREVCRPVEQFDDALEQLVADMVETMSAAPGIGLAAAQVGVLQRVAVVDLSAGREPDELHVLINPEIVRQDGASIELEGCLSIPDFSEKVVRPADIEVSAMDAGGQPFFLAADSWLARAICHEVDHLDGLLFVDHLRGLKKERARRHLKRMARDAEGSRRGSLQ